MAILLAAWLTVSLPSASIGQAYDVTAMEVTNQLNPSSIGVTHAGDGSGRLFVVAQSGEIQIWDGSQVLAMPFLDVSALVSGGFEQGLLGLAFHPDYETNGFFYLNYTNASGDTVVARYTVSGDPNVADAMSSFPILSFPQPTQFHNGGDLHFGPDGYLYIASGDGDGDPCDAQDDSNLLGKILRIDVDGDDFPGDPARNYSIPPDNPLVGVGGAAEEIWILGLRNPWRFGFDRANGDLLVGDVGDNTWEEFDYLAAGSQAGANMGWPWFEGEEALQTCPDPPGSPFADCADGPFTCPIASLHHGDGACSGIGGFRYRGSQYPSLVGSYFFSDWCQGHLHAAFEVGGGSWMQFDLGVADFGATGFGEDEAGELFLVVGSRLLQITGTGPLVFDNGFESGDTSFWTLTVP